MVRTVLYCMYCLALYSEGPVKVSEGTLGGLAAYQGVNRCSAAAVTSDWPLESPL